MSETKLTPYHSLSIEQVLARVQGRVEGLYTPEVERKQLALGLNLPLAPQQQSWFQLISTKISGSIFILLLALLALAIFSGDGFSVFFGLCFYILLSTAQEIYAKKIVVWVRQQAPYQILSLRDGRKIELPVKEIVRGDIVFLEAGQRIAADLRVILANQLEVDESILTGQQQPIAKSASAVPENTSFMDRTSMVFAGSKVLRGKATAIAVRTGFRTELARLERIKKSSIPENPLPEEFQKMSRVLKRVGRACGILIAGLALIQGAARLECLILVVILSLPALLGEIISCRMWVLNVAHKRFFRAQVIVQNTAAIEDLSATTVLAVDKTGTLTLNELTVRKVAFPEAAEFELTGAGIYPEGEWILWGKEHLKPLIESLCLTAELSSDANLYEHNDRWYAFGNPMDIALLSMAQKYRKRGPRSLPLQEIVFESERMFSATMHNLAEVIHVSVKGAPEKTIPLCTSMLTPEGIRPIDVSGLLKKAHALAEEGFRVLALAHRLDGERQTPLAEQINSLCFLALVAINDPLRPDSKSLIQKCQESGIKVAMVTGDHPSTALKIAQELGLATSLDDIVTGARLRGLVDDQDYYAAASYGRVFARIEPAQKLQLVNSLQERGNLVTLTGHGANDVAALSASHVGVSMGTVSTDNANEAADIILLNDRLATLVEAIAEAIAADRNISSSLFYSLASTLSLNCILLSAVIVGVPLPLSPIQLLWFTTISLLLLRPTLAFEPASKTQLQPAPKEIGERRFTKLFLKKVLLCGLLVGFFTIAIYLYWLKSEASLANAKSEALLSLVVFQFALLFSSRPDDEIAFLRSPTRNRILIAIFAAVLCLHVLISNSQRGQDWLGLVPTPLFNVLIYFLVAIVLLFFMELYKRLLRKSKNIKYRWL